MAPPGPFPRLRPAALWPALAAGAVAVLLLSVLLPPFLERRAALALVAGVALGVTAIVAWWLDRRLYRPLARVLEGAGELAAGKLRHRVDVPEDDDLAALALALNRLAGRVEEQIAAVEARRDHLQGILSSMAEGVLVVDRRGRAGFANPAFRRMFQVEGEVEGLLPLEITRRGELAAVVERTLEEGRPLTTDVEMRSPERHTLALASAVLSGEPGGAVVVVRDVTESRRLADMRRDFVASVSHELKTPLSAIRGFAETLRDGALEDPGTARRFTDRILEQSQRLQALLNDLLILSRLESAELPLDLEETVDLARVVRRAVEVVQPQARDKKIEIRIEGGPIPHLAGNSESLERLVLNLLENAVKYNRPGGHATVRLRSFKRPRGTGQMVLEVTDDGIGIPSESLPRIFERFYRVDKGRSREEGGTGLGLAIVKHVAQVHDGRVEVESRLGGGTTFRVRLPLRAPHRPPADTES
jgi:two-component system phosphate regulon sensor histidine kinase PhoR